MTLYEQVVDISEDYLGPAAGDFVDRQISIHLEKPSSELKKDDLMKLADWIKLSLALLTKDKGVVDDCADRIIKLSKEKA